MRQTVTGKKEQDTMKKAFKAYIIEVDKDGNQVKMLHESIVFAVTKDKAEQAVIIEATTGGVIDANTNFVVVAATPARHGQNMAKKSAKKPVRTAKKATKRPVTKRVSRVPTTLRAMLDLIDRFLAWE
jgi:hypothetical protein